MKRDKLYTATKANRGYLTMGRHKFALGGPYDNMAVGTPISNYADGITNNFTQNGSQSLSGLATQNKPAIYNTGKGINWGQVGQAGQAIAGSLLSTPQGNDLLDTLDPMYHIAGGRESGVGNAFDTAGKGLFTTGVSTGNPWLMLAGAGAKVIGGGINTLFGKKLNKKNINDVENFITNQRTAGKELSGAQTSDALVSGWGDVDQGYTFNRNYIGKDGVFNHGATAKTHKLWGEQKDAQNYLTHSFMQGLGNVDKMDNRRVMTNFTSNAAFGGPLDVIANNGMGAIGYGFMSDYMNMKNNQVQGNGKIGANYFSPATFAEGGSIHIDPKNRGKLTETMRRTGKTAEELSHSSNPLTRRRAIFALNARKWKHKHDDGGILDNMIDNNDTLFAFGGDLQTNSSDFGTGLTHIDAGGTHEESPYEGVQYGIASDGEPNLVEEGETVFNDYVFSNRIKPKKSVLKQFHMYSNGGKLTYADVSKKLEKEAQERPNDPKSQAALKNMLSKLADAQEEQKAEEEAREARKAFEALSPEEQAAVMRQLAEQQQAAEQQENAEAPQEEVPVDENGNPMEQSQEMTQEVPVEEQPQEALMGAYGGKLGHRFDKGGWKKSLYNALGLHTASDWNKFIKDAGITDFDINKYGDDTTGYAKMLKELQQGAGFDKLKSAISKKNEALADALGSGYDFGTYIPSDNGYNLADYAKTLSNYTKSKTKGNTTGNYAIDKDFGLGNYKTIQDLENSEAYKNYTNALVDVANAAQGQKFKLNNGVLENVDGQDFAANNLQLLNTLYNTAQGTSTFDKGEPVPMFVDNGDGTYSIAKNAKELLIGSDGKSGLRYDGKGGIFHLTPTANTRNSVVVNRIINDDGTIEDILGDVPNEWGKAVNTYSWNDPENNYTYNYYKRATTPSEAAKDAEEPAKLAYESNPYRYAGLMAPVMGLGLHAAGVGKPDYTGLEASMDYLNNGNTMADYKPIGSYLQYRPYDSQNAINRANATALGVNRGLMNSNSPIGTRNAALLANAMNTQNSQGELGLRGSQYNDAMRQQVASFNRETDKANADAYNRVSLANAEQRQRNAQLRASMAADIANARLAGDAEWNNGLYQGLTSLGSALNKRAKEIDTFNMARAYINSGAAGAATPELAMMLRTKRKSKGGKINKRKRGLTF